MNTESNSISFSTGISARLGQVPGPEAVHSEAHCANGQTEPWVDKTTYECCQHLRLDSWVSFISSL